MPAIKANELRAKSVADLRKELLKGETKLAQLRSERMIKEATNTREIRNLRRYIARLKTVLNEKDKE